MEAGERERMRVRVAFVLAAEVELPYVQLEAAAGEGDPVPDPTVRWEPFVSWVERHKEDVVGAAVNGEGEVRAMEIAVQQVKIRLEEGT